MTDKESSAHVGQMAVDLAEHFDAVQIFACRHADGKTFCVSKGAGNWYARRGMVSELSEQFKAEQIAEEIAEATKSE